MKKYMKIILSVVATILLVTSINAQSTNDVSNTNAPSNVDTFFNSAQSYLTSFNTNYTWTNVTFEAALGYKQVAGVGAASTLEAQRDIKKFNFGTAFQFSGVGGVVDVWQGQVGYAIIEHYDAKVDLNLRPGYDWVRNTGVVEPGIFILKKGTKNTFFKSGLTLPMYFSGPFNRSPSFYIETGFTY